MHAVFRYVRPEARYAVQQQLAHSFVPVASASERDFEPAAYQGPPAALTAVQWTPLVTNSQNEWASTVANFQPFEWSAAAANVEWPGSGDRVQGSEVAEKPSEARRPRGKKARDNAATAANLVLEKLSDAAKGKDASLAEDAASLAGDAASVVSVRSVASDSSAVTALTSDQADDMLLWLTEGDAQERQFATEQITGLLWQLSCTQCGSRVVQKVLEIAEPADQCLLAKQLRGHVREAAKSPHANYVLQKCIELMPTEETRFIVEELNGKAVVTSRHRFGCRILQRLIEHLPSEQTDSLVDEVMTDADRLCRHPFGNFVVQHILEHGTNAQRGKVVDVLIEDAPGLARHRIGSHVVQRALAKCTTEDRERLTRTLLGSGAEELKSLAHSQYGSFVVRELTGKK